jgi:hypothetical protein
VATYDANINIVVSGQQRLDYVLNSVDKLNAVVAKLKPINLLAPGAGAGGDAIRVARKELDDFARALVNFKPQGIQKRAEELSNTLAGATDQAAGLSLALANVGLKSGGFKQQAAEVKNYALALDTARSNAARLNAISQTVQRGARVQNIATRFNVTPEQVEQRLANLREAAAKRQAKLDEAERQRDVQKLMMLKREEDFELRLGRVRERNAAIQQKEAARRTKQFGVSDAVIGGAFPLLFGQGAGAALGGALGGGIGASVGGGKGGFGGSLVGTLAGQATIDFAINSALELGNALKKPTQNIQELIKFLGISGSELGANISVLQELGLESTASALALGKLEEILQAEGYKNLDTLSKQLTDLENAFSRLKLASANLLAEPLTDFLNWLTDTIKLISRAGGVGGFITTSPEKLQAIDREIQKERANATSTTTTKGPAEIAAEQAITAEQNRQVGLAKTQFELERDRLGLTRVALASRQGDVELLRISNELEKKNLELKNAQEQAVHKRLALEVAVLQQQQAQAQAAQRNAVIEAQRAVARQIGGLMIEQTELENQIYVLRSESAKLLQGEAAGLASQLDNIEQRYENELGILFVRRDLEQLGVNEVEVLQEISAKYDGLASAVQQRLRNEVETLKQQQAQYNLTQLQIEQQRQLANLETRGRFQIELQRTQSFQDPVGIGFFGEAILNQKLALEEYSVTLSNYDAQLLALEERMAVPGLNPDVLQGLTQQSEALKDQVALYKEYQPAIIQARLEQEKFNTIFSATSPIVDNLFNSISNVVAGTMTAKEAFASFLNSIADMLADVAKKMIAQYIAIGIARMFAGVPGGNGFSPLSNTDATSFGFNPGAMTGSLTPGGLFAKGGVFAENSIVPFAAGGVVGSPTMFKFADGGAMRTGLMGEAGPEAIMPLTRGPGGQLGVSNFGGGGGAVNVVVNVDAKGSSVEGDEQGANQLGRVISAAVQSELIKQQRPGGILAR